MHIELTEKELFNKFRCMGDGEIIDYLMGEGLTLKSEMDFKDAPRGIYRRRDGLDLIRLDWRGKFSWVDQHNDVGHKESIDWTLTLGGGNWWVQVLDHDNKPVKNGFLFRVDEDGNRIA